MRVIDKLDLDGMQKQKMTDNNPGYFIGYSIKVSTYVS